MPHEGNLNALKSTGTCKPKGEHNLALGNLEAKVSEPAWWGGGERPDTGLPQPIFAVKKDDIEVPNLGMVEATHEAEWPLQGLAIEPECGLDLPAWDVLQATHRH